MAILELNVKAATFVVIGLQEGILPFAGGPHATQDMVAHAVQLAEKFRIHGSPVVVVRIGWSDDYAEALKQLVDTHTPARALPENWWHYLAALGKYASDVKVTKRQWGAFYGTDLGLQLRRRGIDTIVPCGISTDIGVESAARNAWGLGFSLITAEDTYSAASAEQHQGGMTHVFLCIARVRSVGKILQAL